MDAENGNLRNAANNGELERVVYYVQRGASPNEPNSHGATALYLAAQNGHVEVVKFLLQHGVDPLIRSKGRFNSLSVAVCRNQSDVVEAMLNGQCIIPSEELSEALTCAVMHTNIDILRQCLSAGADPYHRCSNPLANMSASEVAQTWITKAVEPYRSRFFTILEMFESSKID